MINVDADLFKDHVATFKDYGDIKILDFKKPESQHYHIRFTFDESFGYFNISGDLGFLTAVQRGSMTYDNFSSYSSPEYFEEKVVCHDRPFYEYDEDLAREELKEWIGDQDYPEKIEEAIDEIMEDFDDETGISQDGWDKMTDIDQDAWEIARAISDERDHISRGRSAGEIMQDILDLPSVTPKQKTGEWIELKDHKPEAYENVLVRDIDGDVTCAYAVDDIRSVGIEFYERFSGEQVDDVVEWREIP